MFITRRGWCPRTGKGQRLMFKEAVSEYIWLATCQGRIYENKPPSATPGTINSAFVTLPRVPNVQSEHVKGCFLG